jgi:hypothetical protein
MKQKLRANYYFHSSGEEGNCNFDQAHVFFLLAVKQKDSLIQISGSFLYQLHPFRTEMPWGPGPRGSTAKRKKIPMGLFRIVKGL